jgi:hypothetical protein
MSFRLDVTLSQPSVVEPSRGFSLIANKVGRALEVIVPMKHTTMCDDVGGIARAQNEALAAGPPTFSDTTMTSFQNRSIEKNGTMFNTDSASVVNSGMPNMHQEFMSRLAHKTVPLNEHHSKLVQRMRSTTTAIRSSRLHRVPETEQTTDFNHEVLDAFRQWNGYRCHSRASQSSLCSVDSRDEPSKTSSTLSNLHRIPSTDLFDERTFEFDLQSVRSAERCKTPLFRKDSKDSVAGIPLTRSKSAPNALWNLDPFRGPTNGTYASMPCVVCKRYTVFDDYDRHDGSSSCDSCGVVQPSTQKISRNRNGGGDEQDDKTVRADAPMPYASTWSNIRSKRDLNAAERRMNGHQSTCVPSKFESAQNYCVSQSNKQWDKEHQSSKTDHQKRVDLIVVQTIAELHSLVDNQIQPFHPNTYLIELIESTIRRFASSYVSHRLVCTNKIKCFLMDDWKTKVVMAVCASVCIEDCIRQSQEDAANGRFKHQSWGNVDVLQSMLVFIRSKIGKGRTMEAENTCKLARHLFNMTDPALPCNGNRRTGTPLQTHALHPNPLMRMRSEGKCDSDDNDTSSISSRSTNQELIAINFGLGATGVGSPLGHAAHGIVPAPFAPPPPPCSPLTTPLAASETITNEFVFKKALVNLSQNRSLKIARTTIQKVKEMLSIPSELDKLIRKQQTQQQSPEQVIMDLCTTVTRMTVNASQFTPIDQAQELLLTTDIRSSPTKRVKIVNRE